jgi:hypothetical protein
MDDPEKFVLLDVAHNKPQHTPRVSPCRQAPPLLARQMGLNCPDRVRSLNHPDPAVLNLLERFGSPAQIRMAGRRRLVTLLRPKAPRMAERLVEEIFTALDEQTVTVPGIEAAALIVPSLADPWPLSLTSANSWPGGSRNS